MEKIFSMRLKNEVKESLEIQLAKKAKCGDSEAFAEVYKIYSVYLYKIAYSYVKNEDKALDILQESAYKGLLKVTKLSNHNFFKTWITKVLINVAIDYIRKDNKVIYLENESVIVSEEKSIPIEDKLDLYNAIDGLRESYKTVIILKYFNYMSIDEISYVMNIPINTVKSNLKRAKESLNKVLREEVR